MEFEEFRKDFLESVKLTAANDENGTVASFVKEGAERLRDAGVIPDYEPSFHIGTGKRNRKIRVDGYAFDEFDETMTLIIADFTDTEDQTINMSQSKQFFDRLHYFLDESFDGNLYHELDISDPAHDLVDFLRRQGKRVCKYSFVLLTDRIGSQIKAFPMGDVKDVPVEYHLWDMTRFFRIFGNTDGRDELVINLSDYSSKGIPCLEASDANTDEFRSFLCVLPANLLSDIFDRYGSRLLEGNVRSFLSTKVAVNKQIRGTILGDPTKFFAFNNGIAATATEVTIEDRPTGRVITSFKGLQIVNGGQTTASLALARYKDKADLSKIYVQMKLTEVEPQLAQTIIPQISRSSNSQNKVSEADFFSNHQFHIRMEQISSRVFAPAVNGAQYETHWFYERTRGQFLQSQSKMTQGEKNKFLLQNPKKQVITKTDLAKFQNAWKGLPQKVSLGAQKNFVQFANSITEQWEHNDAQFNEAYFKECASLAILFRFLEGMVSKQPWYEKGYRANIVAYSVALLSHLISSNWKGKSLNFQEIWSRQDIPAVIEQQMVVVTKAVFDVLTAEDRGVQNVTEWSKRDACWERVKKLDVLILKELENYLISKDEVTSINREAKKQQVEINGIEAQATVVNYGVPYWQAMFEWATMKQQLLTPEESQLFRLASTMRANRLPNPIQCNKLLELRERMILEGYQESVVLAL